VRSSVINQSTFKSVQFRYFGKFIQLLVVHWIVWNVLVLRSVHFGQYALSRRSFRHIIMNSFVCNLRGHVVHYAANHQNGEL
jgi:hypothetical protein